MQSTREDSDAKSAPERSARAGSAAVVGLGSWVRWGWAPLVAGCAALTVATMLVWELVLVRLGASPPGGARVLLLARGITMSFVLAVFVGWYVVRSARRIERVREAIRARQSEIEAAARRAEQDAALGAMARILSHEIRNPLNCLALASKLLDREVAAHAAPSKRLVEVAATIASETNRLGDLVQGYLAHAEPRANDLIIEPVRLERVVEEVVGAVRPLFEASHVSIEIEGGTPETIPVDVGRIRTLLRELLENALEAVRVGGRVRITLGGDTRQATLAISDDGPGFADPEAALRPFYTTKSSGLGIGLALVRDIVRAHRGQIRARNLSPYGGASVEVGLPSGASA